jgi:hypothetical protein
VEELSGLLPGGSFLIAAHKVYGYEDEASPGGRIFAGELQGLPEASKIFRTI